MKTFNKLTVAFCLVAGSVAGVYAQTVAWQTFDDKIFVNPSSAIAGIGCQPKTGATLTLSNGNNGYTNPFPATGIFGLHSTVNNATAERPSYGIYSENTNVTPSTPGTGYGAYFKNRQDTEAMTSSTLYGLYLDNFNGTYGNTIYGSYINNVGQGYSNNLYGYYVKNSASGYGVGLTGFYAENIGGSGYRRDLYGIHLKNHAESQFGTIYGIHSENINDGYASVYGAYLSATSSNASTTPGYTNTVYGLYSTVSGGTKCYSGYFTGGKVVIMNGSVGIGKEPTAGLLDVAGSIAINGNVVIASDERLKTAIKPLADEKDKLYLLEGKSYKKALPPIEIKDSLAAAQKAKMKEEPVEFSEYGYLAQELKEIFPDLVSQDSAGYYSVNYIGLIPVIIEALKAQRTEIEEQREQIKQLVKLVGIKSIDKKAFEANGIASIPVLLQNTPNPFNRETEIGYFIPETVNSADIYIYDVNGVQQRNISITERGKGITTLQATELQAGIYFYTLICDGQPVDTKQMILTK